MPDVDMKISILKYTGMCFKKILFCNLIKAFWCQYFALNEISIFGN